MHTKSIDFWVMRKSQRGCGTLLGAATILLHIEETFILHRNTITFIYFFTYHLLFSEHFPDAAYIVP